MSQGETLCCLSFSSQASFAVCSTLPYLHHEWRRFPRGHLVLGERMVKEKTTSGRDSITSLYLLDSNLWTIGIAGPNLKVELLRFLITTVPHRKGWLGMELPCGIEKRCYACLCPSLALRKGKTWDAKVSHSNKQSPSGWQDIIIGRDPEVNLHLHSLWCFFVLLHHFSSSPDNSMYGISSYIFTQPLYTV